MEHDKKGGGSVGNGCLELDSVSIFYQTFRPNFLSFFHPFFLSSLPSIVFSFPLGEHDRNYAFRLTSSKFLETSNDNDGDEGGKGGERGKRMGFLASRKNPLIRRSGFR